MKQECLPLGGVLKFVKKKEMTKTPGANGNVYGFNLSVTTTAVLVAYAVGKDYALVPYSEGGSWGFNVQKVTSPWDRVTSEQLSIVIYYIDLADYLQTS